MKTLAVSVAISAAVAGQGFAETAVGFDRFDYRAQHRAAPIAAGVWSPISAATYPAEVGGNPVFRPVTAYLGAALPDAKLPLVIVSHGSGSSMDGTAWLGAGLAARGAMVVVLNHPGTTSGDSSPRRTVRLAERAADLGAALDHLLDDPYFAARIDPAQVSAVGFSLGGSAVLGLAGQRLDAGAYAAYCGAHGETAQDCQFLAKGGVDLSNLPAAFSTDMTDDRFTRIVAVDPGFTYSATRESLSAIEIPVQVVSLGDDFPWPTVDVRPQGSGLVDAIPGATHTVIANAHHFSFLPLCTPMAEALLIEEGEDPICTDPAGSDRATVHAASLDAISGFLGLQN